MTTLQLIRLTCLVCDTPFDSQAVSSTNSFGGKRTDFHERAAGTQPLPHLVHMCPKCGYTGTERDFDRDETEVSITVTEHVWSELAPLATRGSAVTGSEKYEAAAKVADWRGEGTRHIADLYLRAAWCCVDEGDVEAERYYRRKAVAGFSAALDMYGEIPQSERAVMTYLVGELHRRIGDVKTAHRWFDKVEGEIEDMTTQKWILDTAKQQRDYPREWFA
jgi:hypothetical protein